MYLSIKALHIIAVISWMAGLLYLPRLFVYHSDVKKGSDQSSLFKIMEYRLFKYIMTPAMYATVFSGVYLAFAGIFYFETWFLLKASLLIFMLGVHLKLGRHVKMFQNDLETNSSKYFRVLNEAPTLLMIGIVVLVVLKPF